MEFKVNQKVWVPKEYYQVKGEDPVGFDGVTFGHVSKVTKKTVTVATKNKDRFGAKKKNKRYPIAIVFKSQRDAQISTKGK